MTGRPSWFDGRTAWNQRDAILGDLKTRLRIKQVDQAYVPAESETEIAFIVQPIAERLMKPVPGEVAGETHVEIGSHHPDVDVMSHDPTSFEQCFRGLKIEWSGFLGEDVPDLGSEDHDESIFPNVLALVEDNGTRQRKIDYFTSVPTGYESTAFMHADAAEGQCPYLLVDGA